jgi:hypothetical protein
MKLLKDNNEYMLIDSSRNLIATTDESIIKASPKKHKLCRNNCNEIFDFTDINELGSEYAWLYAQGKGLSNHKVAKQSFIDGFTACHVAEAYKFKVTDMIEFATWMNKLTPAQRVSVWSKNGEHQGLFTMDEEQLFEKWLHIKSEIDVEVLYDKDCYSSAGRCDKLTMAQCIICTPVYPLKDDNDCIILNKL